MSGNTNMRPAGIWNYREDGAGVLEHLLLCDCDRLSLPAKDALDAHFRVIEQELEGCVGRQHLSNRMS